MESLGLHSMRERHRERVNTKTLFKIITQSVHSMCSVNTFIQVLYGLTEILTVLQYSLKSPYANSQIYFSRNICPMAYRYPHRFSPSYAPVCIPVYALGLTDQSQLIRSSACSADPEDVDLVSQHI